MPTVRVIKQVDKDPEKHGMQARWSDKQRYEAVILYKTTGNMAAVSRSLGIPERTLLMWKKSSWWPQFEDDLLQQKKAITSSRLEKLAQKAAEITADRLENGDWVFINGNLERKPVNALVANKILTDSLTTQTKLEEHYSKQVKTESDLQINERLNLLLAKMTDFAKSGSLRTAKGGDPHLPVIDGEFAEVKDAVHDQREAKL